MSLGNDIKSGFERLKKRLSASVGRDSWVRGITLEDIDRADARTLEELDRIDSSIIDRYIAERSSTGSGVPMDTLGSLIAAGCPERGRWVRRCVDVLSGESSWMRDSFLRRWVEAAVWNDAARAATLLCRLLLPLEPKYDEKTGVLKPLKHAMSRSGVDVSLRSLGPELARDLIARVDPFRPVVVFEAASNPFLLRFGKSALDRFLEEEPLALCDEDRQHAADPGGEVCRAGTGVDREGRPGYRCEISAETLECIVRNPDLRRYFMPRSAPDPVIAITPVAMALLWAGVRSRGLSLTVSADSIARRPESPSGFPNPIAMSDQSARDEWSLFVLREMRRQLHDSEYLGLQRQSTSVDSGTSSQDQTARDTDLPIPLAIVSVVETGSGGDLEQKDLVGMARDLMFIEHHDGYGSIDTFRLTCSFLGGSSALSSSRALQPRLAAISEEILAWLSDRKKASHPHWFLHHLRFSIALGVSPEDAEQGGWSRWLRDDRKYDLPAPAGWHYIIDDYRHHNGALERLLRDGIVDADMLCPVNGKPLLLGAITSMDTELVSLLLKHGADPRHPAFTKAVDEMARKTGVDVRGNASLSHPSTGLITQNDPDSVKLCFLNQQEGSKHAVLCAARVPEAVAMLRSAAVRQDIESMIASAWATQSKPGFPR